MTMAAVYGQLMTYSRKLDKTDGLLSTIMPLPAATLIFDFLTRQPNQYVSWHRHICDLILMKLVPVVMKILYSPFFQAIAYCNFDV